jgi:hypothetical protein
MTTNFLSNQFGCGELVRRVRLAFPRDVPSDPWEFMLVLGAWRSGALTDAPPIAALVHTALSGGVRSEFARRLMARQDVDVVLDAVDLDSLAAWVMRTFRPIDFWGLRYELAAEFEVAAESFPPPPRMTVDTDTNTVFLDGVAHKVEPEGAAVVKAVIDAHDAGELPASTRQIRRRMSRCNHDTTFRRWRDALPAPIRNCIKGKDGVGVYLELPLAK